MYVLIRARFFKALLVLILAGLTTICKIALVIIENDTRWLVENFVLSRYNHRYM